MNRVEILALDLATRTGWRAPAAVGVCSGVQSFARQRGESEGMVYIHFGAWLRKMVRETGARVLAYEMPHMRGGAASTLLIGLETRVHEVSAELGVEHQKKHSASIKLHVTGHGDAMKTEVTRWAAAKLGRAPTTDDEADAVALYSLMDYELNGVVEPVKITNVQRQIRKKHVPIVVLAADAHIEELAAEPARPRGRIDELLAAAGKAGASR